MGFNESPNNGDWLEDWNYDANSEVITVGADAFFGDFDQNGVDNGFWDGATGDIRQIVRGFIGNMYQKMFVDTPLIDRPANMLIKRTRGILRATGQVTETYSVRFVTDPVLTVAAE